MKTKTTIALTDWLCACSLCAADMTVATLYDSQLKMAEGEVVSLAKAMPESAYNFAPTQGAFEKVRTFGEQVKHIATVMYLAPRRRSRRSRRSISAPAKTARPAVKTKAEIVKYLQDAFAYAHTAMAVADRRQPARPGARRRSPACPTWPAPESPISTIWHSFDHYGQMAVYARMNNVIPPASMPAPPPAGAKKKK